MGMTVGKKRKGEKVQLERTVEGVDGWYVVLVQPA
jgi:hypothetical protein